VIFADQQNGLIESCVGRGTRPISLGFFMWLDLAHSRFFLGGGVENRFFSPQLWGWLAREVFVDQQNGLKSKRFSSFRINFTHVFGGSIFFTPNFGGG